MSEPACAAIGTAPCLVFAYQEIGYACLGALLEQGAPIIGLFTYRDDPHEQVWWHSCADLARQHQIPVYFDIKLDRALIERIYQWQPAIIYSFMYRDLLPAALLDCARLGAFNLHPSKLPAYRGRAPVNWALVMGARETGVTLHYMVARADAGDIVAQTAIPIEQDDTALSLHRKLVPQAADLIRRYHPLIAAGRAPRSPQDLSAGSIFGRRTPADGRIDWRWPARRIHNLVRAVTHPYPGAFCMAGGRRLMVWQAAIACEDGSRGEPGRLLGPGPDGTMEIAAGTGSIWLRRLQWEGETEGPAATVLTHAIDEPFKLQ